MAVPFINSIAEYVAPRLGLAPIAGTGAVQNGALIDPNSPTIVGQANSAVATIQASSSGGVTGGLIWSWFQSTSDSTGATGWTNVPAAASPTPSISGAAVLGLTGITASGGSGYAINDTITLAATFPTSGGVQTTAIVLKVLTVTSGAITTFQIMNPGSFSAVPLALSQASTSGAGINGVFSGFSFAPVFSATFPAGPNASVVYNVPLNLNQLTNRYVRIATISSPTGGTPASIVSAAVNLGGYEHLPAV